MNALEQIAIQKTALQDRITRDQKRLSDLEAAERVLPSLEASPVRARTAHVTETKAEAVAPVVSERHPDAAPRRRGRPRTGNGVKAEKSGTTIGYRVLEVVARHGADGITKQHLNEALAPARPNHIGIAIMRHRKAIPPRIVERDGAYYPA